MKLSVAYLSSTRNSTSPYRLLDELGQEVAWANAFLDAQRVRQLSLRSLRAYAYDLLHFARWFQQVHQPLSEITESTLLDYVRYQLDQQPKLTPQTVNHRLGVVHCISLLISLPLWTCNSRRPVLFPTYLYEAISARLWPATACGGSGPPLTATQERHCATRG